MFSPHETVAPGTQTINFSSLGSPQSYNVETGLFDALGVLVIPDSSIDTGIRRHQNNPPSTNGHNGKSIENISSVSTSSRVRAPFWHKSSDNVQFSSLSSDMESLGIAIGTGAIGYETNDWGGEFDALDFGLYALSGQRDIQMTLGDGSRELDFDSFILGSNGCTYSPQEMFGLSKDEVIQDDAMVKDDNDNDGDDNDDATEECLICLTEQKEVLLLPCR